MSREHVSHATRVAFAQDRVNLPKDKADEYRAQAKRLRERLESYLDEHPDFTLRKMLLSGSLAKGTALRSLNDIDVACYISGAEAPHEIAAAPGVPGGAAAQGVPELQPDQVKPQTYSVTVSFSGTGLDVDVVPILYDGDPEWYGNLVSQDDGSFLKTSIPLHLEFIRKRKDAQQTHFAQVVRLVKFWAATLKSEQRQLPVQVVHDRADPRAALRRWSDLLRLPGGAAALLHLCRTHRPPGEDRLHRLLHGFGGRHLHRARPDHRSGERREQRQPALHAGAGDAISRPRSTQATPSTPRSAAPTKQETVYYWQKVFGSAFQV